MVTPSYNIDPPAMPDIRGALVPIPDAIKALERAASSWNRTQLKAHLDSAQAFINGARIELARTLEVQKVLNPVRPAQEDRS